MDDRNRRIGEMFSAIAPRYDLLNRLLSLGQDRRWRREAVARIVPEKGGRHLDMATGTADVALEILRRKGGEAFVVGSDISAEMMRIGLEKAARAGGRGRLAFVQAPGEALPFRDGVFDSASVAFGIRNVVDRELPERDVPWPPRRAYRHPGVLQPEGTIFGALSLLFHEGAAQGRRARLETERIRIFPNRCRRSRALRSSRR